jgi:hypothetical protein
MKERSLFRHRIDHRQRAAAMIAFLCFLLIDSLFPLFSSLFSSLLS